MISAATIAALEERNLEYILGVRERSSKEVREIVMADPAPSVPLVIPHKGRPDADLQAKEVKVDDRRYIVCRNLAEAAQAARTREAVLTTLRAKLKQGDKALVGNSAYRRYLKTPDQQHFTIDEDRIADEARYDGLYILRTNTRLHPQPSPHFSSRDFKMLRAIPRIDCNATFDRRACRTLVSRGIRVHGGC